LVTGEAIIGANIFKDVFAGIRDIVGGRSAAYERELAKARTMATEEMQEQATELGADAIIGAGMLLVTISGTAVRLGA
jgi:uncharacterized protein YbjQ (UPF0145 family)